MFNLGELVIYSGHGICQVDDICDKTFLGNTKTYYVLHPLENNHKLTISIPIDSEKVAMSKLMNKEEAEEILQSFALPGVEWVENNHNRIQTYNNIVKSGNRLGIAKVVNTLMRKKHEQKINERKFGDQDNHQLTAIQNILFKELAIILHTSFSEIDEKVSKLVEKSI